MMKLRGWASKTGVSYKTALRWFHAGILPVPARQLSTGTLLGDEPALVGPGTVALYARVSGSDQKSDLEAQLGRIAGYAHSKRLTARSKPLS